MNNKKTNSYGKLLVFFLVAVILVLSFGFVADGWQPSTSKNENSGNADGNNGFFQNGEVDNNKFQEGNVYIPEHISPLTGLESEELTSTRAPLAISMSTATALYGISYADMLIEFPIENGDTRFLLMTTDYEKLGKIGSISPTRAYISTISKAFGTILVSNGDDDKKSYPSAAASALRFDLSAVPGYHYTEYNQFAYTNGDLLLCALSNSGLLQAETAISLPYSFATYGEEISGSISASSVSLPYSQGKETELIYSQADRTYTMAKSGTALHDMLNDKTPKFKNAFILFADTTTYETQDGTHLVMNSIGSGAGYYVTMGTATPITWTVTENGQMTMYDANGSILTANRGTTYIGFFKSSWINENLIK